jgi:N6-adenosine-specific RNA methylase IME4
MIETALVQIGDLDKHLNRLAQGLDQVKTWDEAQTNIVKAAHLRLLAKQLGARLEVKNKATEVWIEAQIRGAEMIEESQKNGDLRTATDGLSKVLHDETPKLSLPDIGVSRLEYHRWRSLQEIPKEDRQRIIHECNEAGEELTRIGIVRVFKRETNERLRAEIKACPIVLPDGKYSCIVIDPPWPMTKIERDERQNQVGFEYPTMTEEELQAFPFPAIAADDCHLYLWTTHKFLPMALRLAEHWGFNYQCLMTWVKNVGFTPFSWMYSTEHVLFCRKGSLQLEKLGLRLDFHAKVREHSRKPDEFYELVRQASPGPRIDIFSREAREGFDRYGKETEKFQEVSA